MPRRVLVALTAVLLTLLAGPAVGSAAALPAAVAGTAAPAAATPPTEPPVVTDNAFLPERDLSDCISAVPQPNCGSEDRGGWRQDLVLGVVVAGLAFVGWRITRAVRRNRRALESSGGH